jgi:hypothetical protein
MRNTITVNGKKVLPTVKQLSKLIDEIAPPPDQSAHDEVSPRRPDRSIRHSTKRKRQPAVGASSAHGDEDRGEPSEREAGRAGQGGRGEHPPPNPEAAAGGAQSERVGQGTRGERAPSGLQANLMDHDDEDSPGPSHGDEASVDDASIARQESVVQELHDERAKAEGALDHQTQLGQDILRQPTEQLLAQDTAEGRGHDVRTKLHHYTALLADRENCIAAAQQTHSDIAREYSVEKARLEAMHARLEAMHARRLREYETLLHDASSRSKRPTSRSRRLGVVQKNRRDSMSSLKTMSAAGRARSARPRRLRARMRHRRHQLCRVPTFFTTHLHQCYIYDHAR